MSMVILQTEFYTFNPRFLSMGFETSRVGFFQVFEIVFQSSFSEYGLWNVRSQKEKSMTENFQSSFSEYGLWNGDWVYLCNCTLHLSILVFWVWALKQFLRSLERLGVEIFQSSFSEYGLWNSNKIMRYAWNASAFNPRFLSPGFETAHNFLPFAL